MLDSCLVLFDLSKWLTPLIERRPIILLIIPLPSPRQLLPRSTIAAENQAANRTWSLSYCLDAFMTLHREKHRIVKKSEHRPPLVTRAGGFFCHFFSHSFYTLAARKPKAMYFLKTWIDISAGTLLGISARKTQILIILVFVAFVTHP